MRARTLAFLMGLLALVVLPTSAFATVALRNYEITVTPDARGESAHFRLLLRYRVAAETKRVGFKYLGSSSVLGLIAHDEGGALLSITGTREASSGEQRIDFTLPEAQAERDQTILIDFDQALDLRYDWAATKAQVGWAHQFKIPVDRMSVTVAGPLGRSGEGFSCSGRGAAKVCTKTKTEPFSLALPLSGSLSIPDLAAPVLSIAFALFILVRRLNKRRKMLLDTRGILPPSALPAYPPYQTGYRAPPPILPAESLQPVLSPEDASAFSLKAVSSICAFLLAVLLVAAFGAAPIPKGALVAVATLCAAIPALVYVARDEGGMGLLAIPVLVAVVFAVSGELVYALVALGVCAVIYGISRLPPGSFQSSGGSGSYASSSSCGGGGGGCGGGGGGGGCGG